MSNLYQDAILDAKALRASAIANAKSALEEAFGPKIEAIVRESLAEKVEEETEMEEGWDMEEGYGEQEEGKMHGDHKMEEADINEAELEEILNQLAEIDSANESLNEAEESEEEEEEETEEESEEETEEEAPAEGGEVSDETKVIEITVGDLKQILQDVMPGGSSEGSDAGDVSLDEILDELEHEKMDEMGTGYEGGHQIPEEEGLYEDTLKEQNMGKSAKFDKSEAERILQLYQKNKSEIDPEAAKAIDAAISSATGKQLEEGDYATAMQIAQIGGGVILSAMLAALAGVGYAAIKGKLPQRPGRGIKDIMPEEKHSKLKEVKARFDKAEAEKILQLYQANKSELDPEAVKAIDAAVSAETSKGLEEGDYATAMQIAQIGGGTILAAMLAALAGVGYAAIKGKLPQRPGRGIKDIMPEEKHNELEEAKATIETLRRDLQEVNLLNAKYLYMNKLFKSNSLTEAQKVKVINALDRATNVKEVKLTYETLGESFSKKKDLVRESVGFASKPAGVAPKANIVEADQFINRWQKLAGIK